MDAARTLTSEVGIKPACDALGMSRAGFYRTQARTSGPQVEPTTRPSPARALSADERQGVLDLLHVSGHAIIPTWGHRKFPTPLLTRRQDDDRTAHDL